MKRRLPLPIVAALLAAIAAVAVTALLVNIFTRQQEALNPFYRVVELNDETVDPAKATAGPQTEVKPTASSATTAPPGK